MHGTAMYLLTPKQRGANHLSFLPVFAFSFFIQTKPVMAEAEDPGGSRAAAAPPPPAVLRPSDKIRLKVNIKLDGTKVRRRSRGRGG